MAPLPTPQELELKEIVSVFRDAKAPAAAWVAYRYARDHGLPVPDIVAAEIDRFVAEITTPLLAAWNGDRESKLRAGDITKAFGCARGKDLAEPLAISRRDVGIYLDFWDGRRAEWPRNEVLEAIRLDRNLSPEAVENIVDRFRGQDSGADPKTLYRDE